MKHPAPKRRRLSFRLSRTGAAVILLIAAIVVAARLYLPTYLRSYVNRTIDQSPDFAGEAGGIEVHLWRGAYSIHDLKVRKRTRTIPVPLFEAKRIDLSVDWSALLHGVARGRLEFDQPKLNFVHHPSPDEEQSGADQPWLAIINDLFPFRIDRASVQGGEFHFRTFHTSPKVDVYLSDVRATLDNLTNVRNTTDPRIATLHVRGSAMDSGRFKIDATLDPHSHLPTFDLAAQLLDLDVNRLNALTLAYGDFDFENGHFDLVVEASARHGRLDGYAKPLFRNVQVVGLRDLETSDPFQVLWESLVGAAGTVFKNQPRDQFGTRITLVGDLDNPRISLLEIVGNVLKNAFIRAYLPRIEGRVPLPERERRGMLGIRAQPAVEGADHDLSADPTP